MKESRINLENLIAPKAGVKLNGCQDYRGINLIKILGTSIATDIPINTKLTVI